MLRMPMLRTLASAFLLGAPVATSLAVPVVPGAGMDVLRHDLVLTPDLTAGTLSGIQTITLRSTQDGLRAIAFSPNAMTISAATLDGRRVQVTSDKKALTFILPAALGRGRSGVLRVSYHGKPARGVIFGRDSVYTSYFACDWMLCLQDSPGDKALFGLDLRLPRGIDSLSVGTRVRTASAKDGLALHSWRSTQPYSSYLYGFAAGKFVRATDGQAGARLEYLSDAVSEADLRRLFGDTRAIVDFMSSKAGLPLPGGRYTQLLVGGREAQEAATYAVIGKGELDREAGNPQSSWVVAHELAHMWWGNLVTCATWREFWLNEGITVFMTAAWKEHRFGRAAYDAELESARQRLARARQAGWDKPLAFPGDYPSLALRRAVQYSKGALFMDHLRTTIGDAAFWAGLKEYTRRHAGGTVTSPDLQRAMEKAGGRDLAGTFAQWVYGN